ncbi:unnamed protein product, partial [marine sediment metagenome]
WEFGWPTIEKADRAIAPGQVAGPYGFPQIKPTTWSEATNQGPVMEEGKLNGTLYKR